MPNQNPPMDMMPQEPMEMGNESMENEMGQDPMMGDEPMDDMGNENADDPKKNIQRLAGELSQALRTYNDEQQSPDTDLNKYVVGMIATQAGKNMTSDEKNEIVKKIQKGETMDDGESALGEGDEMAMAECKQNAVMDDKKKEKRFNKQAIDLKKNPFSSRR